MTGTHKALRRIHTAGLFVRGDRVLVILVKGPDAGTIIHAADTVADARAWRREWGCGMVATPEEVRL
jgi:hypothetical protein